MPSMMKCLACGDRRPVQGGRTVCRCGRSWARPDGPVIEIQGPVRVLVPDDDVETVDGVPWTAVPERPMVVRRAVA